MEIEAAIVIKDCQLARWYPNTADGQKHRNMTKELRWPKLTLTPGATLKDLPEVQDEQSDWWNACRKASTCEVQSGAEQEQFLFYDLSDTGRWAASATIAGDNATIANHNEFPILDPMVVFVGKEGKRGFSNKIAAQTNATVELSPAGDLRAALKDSLVRAGLFDKEADAFLATWARELLETPGARLIYRLPEETWAECVEWELSVEPKAFRHVILVSREITLQ